MSRPTSGGTNRPLGGIALNHHGRYLGPAARRPRPRMNADETVDLTLDSDDDHGSLFGDAINRTDQTGDVKQKQEDDDDDGLFVSEPGNFSLNRGVIDLVDEDEAVSEARRMRVDYVIDLTDERVKKDPESISGENNMNSLPTKTQGTSTQPNPSTSTAAQRSARARRKTPAQSPAPTAQLSGLSRGEAPASPMSRSGRAALKRAEVSIPRDTSAETSRRSRNGLPSPSSVDANSANRAASTNIASIASSKNLNNTSNSVNTAPGRRGRAGIFASVSDDHAGVEDQPHDRSNPPKSNKVTNGRSPKPGRTMSTKDINDELSEGHNATSDLHTRTRPFRQQLAAQSTPKLTKRSAALISHSDQIGEEGLNVNGRPSKRPRHEGRAQGRGQRPQEGDSTENILSEALTREMHGRDEEFEASGETPRGTNSRDENDVYMEDKYTTDDVFPDDDIAEYRRLQSRRLYLRDKRVILGNTKSGKLSSAEKMELAELKVAMLRLEQKMGLDDGGSVHDEDDSDGDGEAVFERLNTRANEERDGHSSSPEPDNHDDLNFVNDDGSGQASSPRGHTQRSRQPKARGRRKPARHAEEYWQRRWADVIAEEDKKAAATDSGDPNEERVRRAPEIVSQRAIDNKRRRMGVFNKPEKKNWWANKRGKDQLLRVLWDENPIMARAAVDSLPLPGPIRATNRKNAINEMMFKIRADRANRGEDDGEMREDDVQMETDRMILDESIKSFGIHMCKASQGYWEIRRYGFKPTLFNLQVVGISWMLRQEYSPSGPYGGILADEMGIGKTIELLGVMSVNRPKPNDPKPTLIVLPAAAVLQWKAEIAKFTDFKKVFVYKSSADVNINILKDCEVILTSYNEVAKAYPSEEAMEKISGQQLTPDEWTQALDQEMGDLLKIDYFRVILDEAHAIKNSKSRTSKAALVLRSKYRWAASGTPIQNNIDELFPYFKFIGAQWSGSLREFRGKLGDLEDADVRDRLMYTLSTLMLRRRICDFFLGRNNLEIPKTHDLEDIWIELSAEEKIIYKRLEARFIDNINQDIANMSSRPQDSQLKKQQKRNKMRTYFAFLTRLRQVVGHPFLLEGAFNKNFNLEDLHYLRKQLKKYGGSVPLHQQLRETRLPNRERVVMDYELDNEEGNAAQYDDVDFGLGEFGYEFNMDSQLAQMQTEKSMWDTCCRSCNEEPFDPQITECGHVICFDCLQPIMAIAAMEGKPWVCPECRMVKPKVEPLTVPPKPVDDDDDDSDDDAADTNRQSGKSKGKGKARANARAAPPEASIAVDKFGTKMGDDVQGGQPKLIDTSKWLKAYDIDPGSGLVPSAKLVALKNQVLKWQREAPDDKIIVFIEWMKLAGLIGRVLQQERIQFVYFWGELKDTKKLAAIQRFEQEPDVKVMITSIKCGSQALNLTCANRVISMDLWWNTAVEQQAFGRVHRVGQTKETYFCRILAHDTVDQRMYDMQRHKSKQIEVTLGDRAGEEKLKMSFEEIQELLVGGSRLRGQDAENEENSSTADEAEEIDPDELVDVGDDASVEAEDEGGERDDRWKHVGGLDNEMLHYENRERRRREGWSSNGEEGSEENDGVGGENEQEDEHEGGGRASGTQRVDTAGEDVAERPHKATEDADDAAHKNRGQGAEEEGDHQDEGAADNARQQEREGSAATDELFVDTGEGVRYANDFVFEEE